MDRLKLKATSASELDMISALAQNGIVLKNSFEFKDNVFFFIFNRFCWETTVDNNESQNYRIHSAIYIKNIEKVMFNNNFKIHERDEFLSLMTIHSNYADEINILFANNALISLNTSKIEVYMKDFHEHWSTNIIPLYA